ncbi:MAG: ABC transporter permease subunit [Kiritimatiellae bacterium]|nr:ABC transporter permease subunit [Kiritimatiellia bacterium]MBR4476692.1 ABC transporter permease subunit [Kiritimatiellia bacterium]
MAIFSPLTVKRFRSFKRIRRAWWSLIGLGIIFVFCMLADVVCPCDPRAVVDTATLEKYRKPVVEQTYDIKTVRYNLGDDGSIWDYEGPKDVNEADYNVTRTQRDGYTRVFMEPKEPPAVTERILPAPEISFPFRPCKAHPFGIDAGGRDVYARVVHGMRIALLFGIILAASGMFIGLVVGAVEGYFGGKVDITLQRFTEIWSAMPFLYIMIFIGSTMGRSFTILLICYAIFNWIGVSYYMRAEFLRLRSRTFVEAAKVQGFSAARIIFGHILPNALTPLITLFPFLLMGAIGSLAALDFLGFGLPPMTPSCGELMNQAQQFRFAWWLILFPALALFIVMLLTVLVGEGLRDAFDPRQKSKLE